MKNDSREDYLINILRISEGKDAVRTSELADYMGLSPGSVTEMLKILDREGYVNYTRYRGVTLTDSGVELARSLRRKHHIMERFLTGVLDMDGETAHEQAHIMEHAISDDAADKICRIAGTSVAQDCATCAHPCSERDKGLKSGTPVTELSVGESAIISHLSSDDKTVVRKLISMGFIPGREIELSATVSDKGARIIRIGETSIALDRNMASAIFVNRG